MQCRADYNYLWPLASIKSIWCLLELINQYLAEFSVYLGVERRKSGYLDYLPCLLLVIVGSCTPAEPDKYCGARWSAQHTTVESK